MTQEDRLDRRQLLAAGIGLVAALPPLAASVASAVAVPAAPLNPDEGVTAPEDWGTRASSAASTRSRRSRASSGSET